MDERVVKTFRSPFQRLIYVEDITTKATSKSESYSLTLIGIYSPANNSQMPKRREIVQQR